MSHKLNLHDGTGILAEVPGYGIVLACGTAYPVNATAGYAPGCLFMHMDGTAYDTVLYCNIGTKASCDFNVVTVAQ